MDRAVKDLQGQVDRKDRQNAQLSEDVSRMREKVDKLLKTIDELQASESAVQLSTRRAERDLREEKERTLRLEREVDSLKTFKSGGSGSFRRGSSIRSRINALGVIEDEEEDSSLSRAPSLTKGFI